MDPRADGEERVSDELEATLTYRAGTQQWSVTVPLISDTPQSALNCLASAAGRVAMKVADDVNADWQQRRRNR